MILLLKEQEQLLIRSRIEVFKSPESWPPNLYQLSVLEKTGDEPESTGGQTTVVCA